MSMNKIKVIQVFESYPLSYFPYIEPLLKALKKRKEIDIQFYAYKGKSNKNLGVKILPKYYIRKLKEKIFNLWNLNALKFNYLELLSIKRKIDIVHIQFSFLYPKIENLLKIPKNKRPKIIITLRGGDTYVKPWINKRWKFFYNGLGNNVDAFITMSEHQKKYLLKWGISEKNIHVIPLSFGEISNVKSKRPNQGVMKIVSAFRMCWEKNIEGNLRVIKILKEKGINVQYDIFGGGPDVGQVYYLIDYYKLQDCVFYRGKIDNKELTISLKKYDFFLQLSHSESLPASILEAQSQGVPCVSSNRGGLPEAIIHGETGFCVESFDIDLAVKNMVDLYNNPSLYESFSKKGIEHVNKNYTYLNEIERLELLYKQVLNI